MLLSRQRPGKGKVVPADLREAVRRELRRIELERNGERVIGARWLPVQAEEVVIIDAGLDDALARVTQRVVKHQVWWMAHHCHNLEVFISVARPFIRQYLPELDRIRLWNNRPFSAVLYRIQSVRIVVSVVGFAQHTDADLDESPARPGLVETERLPLGHKLFRRAR